MSSRTIVLTDALYAYLKRRSLREPPLLARLREETLSVSGSSMQISAEQGQLMALLVALIGARRTLDIGTYTGYSSLCVALVLPEDGRVIACDTSEEWTEVARRYWSKAGVDHKIELHVRPAIETLDELIDGGESGSFDFAFIDADKESYDAYYERSLVLLRPGGLIAVDNVLWGGRVIDPNDPDPSTRAIRALNEKIHDDPRVEMSMIPIGDGLTLARKAPS